MSQVEPATSPAADPDSDPIRVMVVDDSVVVRGIITRLLEKEDEISVVASVGDGEMALRKLENTDIDLVVLDIEMPVMDGMTALPKMIEMKPGLQVIISSTLTLKNAEISLRAMELGATDYVTKPTSSGSLHAAQDYQRELAEKVRILGKAGRRRRRRLAAADPVAKKERVTARQPAPKTLAKSSGRAAAPAAPVRVRRPKPAKQPDKAAPEFALRAPGKVKPSVIAIGSSTGGPQALFKLIAGLAPDVALPIVITQHMPPTFTTILADHITRLGGPPCTEAIDGEPLQPGRIFLAPGDHHLMVESEGGKPILRVTQDPPENFCRPAVDPMLRSLVEVYGAGVLVVMLTGMGHDGRDGSKVVVDAGGSVIAQDEEASVVWGMPGAVATEGLCCSVLPISEMASQVNQLIDGARP